MFEALPISIVLICFSILSGAWRTATEEWGTEDWNEDVSVCRLNLMQKIKNKSVITDFSTVSLMEGWCVYNSSTLFLCSCQRPRYSQLPVWRPCLCLKRMLPSLKDRGGSLVHWLIFFFISRKLLFQELVESGKKIRLLGFTVVQLELNEFNISMSAWHLPW